MFLLKYKLLWDDGNMRKGLCGCACRPETGELPSTIWGNCTRAHPSVRTCWPGPWRQRCQNRWIKDGNEISVENFSHSAAHAEARGSKSPDNADPGLAELSLTSAKTLPKEGWQVPYLRKERIWFNQKSSLNTTLKRMQPCCHDMCVIVA